MKPQHPPLAAPVHLDTANQCLRRGAQKITLTPKAFAVLRYLMAHPGQLVTKEELLNTAWPGIYVGDAALKVCIRRIRQALGDCSHPPQYIQTVHWRGYRFIGKIALSESPLPVVRSQKPEARKKRAVASSQHSVVSRRKQSNIQSLASSVQSPSPAPSTQHPAPPLVGREKELAQLHTWLAKAANGERQIVFVTGEPGIGKTTLVEAFLQSLESRVARPVSPRPSAPLRDAQTLDARRRTRDGAPVQTPNTQHPTPSPWIGRGQCIEHYGAGEAYLPVMEAWNRLCRTPGGERFISVLSQHAPLWLIQMPAVISPAEQKKLRREVQGATRERMLRTMAEAVEALTVGEAVGEPLLLILFLEDLQWSDHSTLELLSFLARRREPARLLLIGTYRLGEISSNGHLKAMKHELQTQECCVELGLKFLTEENVSQYLTSRFSVGARHAAPLRELGRMIHQRTEGNPLFMVDVVEYLVAHGVIVQHNGHWELGAELGAIELRVPASIQQVIETQIDRLSKENQQVLEVASVAGMEFSAAAVAAGLKAEVVEVEERCEGLAREAQFLRASGVSEWPDGTVAARYEFIHALYQQVWYERVTAGRRLQLHRRIGKRGELAYGHRVNEIAAELAVHFERGHDSERAVHYRQQAAESALHLNAERGMRNAESGVSSGE